MLVVNGPARGCKAILLRINESEYNCVIKVEEGLFGGRELRDVMYEDVSKLNTE